MYVCMYVMYVFVCMYSWLIIDSKILISVNRPMYVRMYVCRLRMYVCMYVCKYVCMYVFIHSFIHTEHLHSASSWNYSEALPTPARLKRAFLSWEKKHRWQGPRVNPKLRREPIPDRGTYHGKSTALLSGGTSKRGQKTLLRWAKRSRAHSTMERTTELTKVCMTVCM